MKTDELREKYLEFFESKDCVRRPSDVLVPKGDRSVLFTPAGMNQFKNQFLGVGPLEFTRATTCQKCLRTGDIGNVGVTAYHHTFFEMLGNFSFGDYFKREAIHWAWEFLTDKKWLGLSPDRLSATVYLEDDEAWNIWEQEIGLPSSRIRREDEHENFWPAGAPSEGPDGVCGPCSEIYYHPESGGSEVEIWNLVFTQFNRVGEPPDNLRPLPKKNIDTGMGLERTAAVLQGVESNFEIDTLRPLCEAAGNVVGVKYEFGGEHGRALRRIADHIRAVTMCVHENVVPSNEKQGYVVRLLLRRALLEGFLIGRQDPFLHELVPAVVAAVQGGYPEVGDSASAATNTIREEEEQFLGIIERGLARFERIVERCRASGQSKVSGEEAFELHTQEGFLIEMTEAMAARHNLSVDTGRFRKLLDQHRQTSGKGSFSDSVMAEGPLDAIRKTVGGTEFLGYEATRAEGRIVGVIAEKQLVESIEEVGHVDPIAVVLDRTPFYGEAGGQVGDTGTIETESATFEVIDTQRDGELLLHVGHLRSGTLKVGERVTATVDDGRRAGIRRAHSATHLLHHALRRTLGESAQQRGSKVEDDVLRFDFAHKGPLTREQIIEVEDEINSRIAEGADVATTVTSQKEAKERGAMMLFGEKYPDRVRMVTMGDFSIELCGGTHLSNTGQVGMCRIVSEEPVAKGVRRIVALTGQKALASVREADELLREIAATLKAPQPQDVPRRVVQLQEEVKQLKQQLAAHAKASVADAIGDLLESAEDCEGVTIVCSRIDGADRELLRDYADQIRSRVEAAAILLAAEIDGKVALLAAVSRDLISRGIKAGDCVREAAKVVGGGGGGRPDLAEAGGKDPSKIDDALAAARELYRSRLSQG
ncbi:MAG: alanine--tRNA ligase [Planctomycetota bacterium]|nr:MAG: alanine--tRNA ligase [Planctomycetota bacterium]REK39705.1 MAG: alanine--tRNA ligase [Planctomycetota bacterium]